MIKKLFLVLFISCCLISCFSSVVYCKEYDKYTYNDGLKVLSILSGEKDSISENSYLYPTGELLKSPYELFQYWESKGYPDYVCGVWSTNGGTEELTFGIKDEYDKNGNKIEDVILANIDNDNKVTFVYQKYSKNYLLSIMNDLYQCFDDSLETGFYSMGIYDDKNYVKVGIKKEKEGDIESQKLVNEIKGKYGDAVCIEYTNEKIVYSTLWESDIKSNKYENNKIYIITFLITFLIIVFSLSFLAVKSFAYKKRKNLFLSNGDIRNENIISEEKIIYRIKNSKINPPDSLHKSIINKIKNL